MLILNDITRVYLYYMKKFILTRYLKGDFQGKFWRSFYRFLSIFCYYIQIIPYLPTLHGFDLFFRDPGIHKKFLDFALFHQPTNHIVYMIDIMII